MALSPRSKVHLVADMLFLRPPMNIIRLEQKAHFLAIFKFVQISCHILVSTHSSTVRTLQTVSNSRKCLSPQKFRCLSNTPLQSRPSSLATGRTAGSQLADPIRLREPRFGQRHNAVQLHFDPQLAHEIQLRQEDYGNIAKKERKVNRSTRSGRRKRRHAYFGRFVWARKDASP